MMIVMLVCACIDLDTFWEKLPYKHKTCHFFNTPTYSELARSCSTKVSATVPMQQGDGIECRPFQECIYLRGSGGASSSATIEGFGMLLFQ
jgi:hypothetical protein